MYTFLKHDFDVCYWSMAGFVYRHFPSRMSLFNVPWLLCGTPNRIHNSPTYHLVIMKCLNSFLRFHRVNLEKESRRAKTCTVTNNHFPIHMLLNKITIWWYKVLIFGTIQYLYIYIYIYTSVCMQSYIYISIRICL